MYVFHIYKHIIIILNNVFMYIILHLLFFINLLVVLGGIQVVKI